MKFERNKMSKEINVLELFAGVGGFRIGLENSNKNVFKTKWSNQWEPSRKSQDAFQVYDYHYDDSENINEDIANISDERFQAMDADLIVGGFPCQDYSVARSKKNEKGIEGKKGVLFWEIIRATEQIKPKYLILENVDRLLKSPSKQRGRDFAVMLKSFDNLGYSVEWRVINAAEYGRAQKRRRVFFFVFRNDLNYAKELDKIFESQDIDKDENRYDSYLFKDGLFANQFPIKNDPLKNRQEYGDLNLYDDIVDISDNFASKFWNSGIMRHGKYYTLDSESNFNGEPIKLREIIQSPKEVPSEYYLTDKNKLEKFNYLRGPKKIERVSETGHKYIYSEGGMSQYDDLDSPARTMLTSEGTVNRSTHILNIDGKIRLITPVEAERLQDFPDDWTKYKKLEDGSIEEVSKSNRFFFMGNALVTEIVKLIGDFIIKVDQNEE